jgi:2,3-bisphosphoglycerate-independent phosphoglycerate mutase
MNRPKPVVLAIVSGLGMAPATDGNAVRQAEMPVFRNLVETYPAMMLLAHGTAVGLEEEEGGTPEAGHLTIGAGRATPDPVHRISADMASGSFFRNPALKRMFAHVRNNGGRLHLIGTISEAEVHSKNRHLEALLSFAAREGVKRVFIHAILDGADALPEPGRAAVRSLERTLRALGTGSVASLSGRSWAMRNDGRWDRIRKSYEAMALGRSDERFGSADEAIVRSYAGGVDDGELEPCVILQPGNVPAVLRAGDGCAFFNVPAAPNRELMRAFALPSFDRFERPSHAGVFFVSLTEYDKDLPVEAAYPSRSYEHCLGEVISEAGFRQFRIAETERYVHVTDFLNGMRSEPFPGEDRVIVPSPDVSRYERTPEMSAAGVANRAVKEIALGAYDAIMMNVAAPDVVACSGNEAATVAACEAADKALGKVTEAVLATGGVLLLVSDRGHAEVVRDPATDEAMRGGTRNPVPFIVAGKRFEGLKAPQGDAVGGDLALTAPAGTLADVAPTMLKILGLAAPKEMTGRPLV